MDAGASLTSCRSTQMPRLIEEDFVEVKPDDVKVLEPLELEWIKDKEGVYRHDHFRIVPDGGKFVLEVKEGKGKKAKTIQACKGPLKVCKGFASDISEGRLVKLESGNWGAPPRTEGELKTLGNLREQSISAVAATNPSGLPTDPCGNEIKSTDPDYAEASSVKTPAVEVAASIVGLSQAISLLSRKLPISCLPAGSHFCMDGRFGTFIEMIGLDAKVEFDGKTTQWSGASPVKWAAEKPKVEVKVARQAPAATETSKDGAASASAQAAAPKSVKTTIPQADKSIFGHHVKRVIMAMAVAAFTEAEIALVVKAHHLEVSPSRIALLKKRAINGEDGEPAALTPDQLKQLKNIVGKK